MRCCRHALTWHALKSPLLESLTRVRSGEENEEYEASWSSDWRTSDPGHKGGAFNASAPPQGGAARYGPLASFPFRYLMSSLRALQMQVTHLLASSVVVNSDLYAFVALEIGREADDAPDAFCFMVSAEFDYGRGTVSNWERCAHAGLDSSRPLGDCSLALLPSAHRARMHATTACTLRSHASYQPIWRWIHRATLRRPLPA